MPKRKSEELKRCDWGNWDTMDPIFVEYHDTEWGKPVTNSIQLFEMLCLSGQQAGLTWKVILKKRENYRKAFHNFNPKKISLMTDEDVNVLLNNTGILRNKRKIESIINNAKIFLKMKGEGEDFSEFIWSFVNGKTIIHDWDKLPEKMQTESEESKEMAKALKKKKFSFIGSTICYAYMQSCGLINDHQQNCFTRKGFKKKKM